MVSSFLKSSIFLVLGISLILGCAKKEIESEIDLNQVPQEPFVLVIKDRSDEYSEEITKQINQALEYTKIPFQTLDLNLISDGGLKIPNETRVVVNTTTMLENINPSEIENLVRFVSNGGHMVFTGAVLYSDLTYLQGIKRFADFDTMFTSKGFYLNENTFPNFQGKEYSNPSLAPRPVINRNNLLPQTDVIADISIGLDYPKLISHKIGIGEVVTILSLGLDEKEFRGIIFSSILKGLSGIPYSVANVGTIFLDDFPAPLYNEKIEPIASELDLDFATFVHDVWWPDMKAFADSFNISYSAMTAFNYNASVTPPFDYKEWEAGKVETPQGSISASISLAQNVANGRHELAYHGYNHFSLTLEEWNNPNFMALAQQSVRKRWRVDRLGELPTNYVPPTNFIDSTGVMALTKGLPSINYMSSLYYGDAASGGAREFAKDPYNERIFNYPRITSGSTMSSSSLFDQHSMQLLTGVWNHFIHPDDVLQITQREEDSFESRNPLGLGWKSHPEYGYGMYHVFRERVLYTKKLYPFIRMVTSTQGSRIAEDWRNKRSYYSLIGNQIELTVQYPSNYTPKGTKNNEHHWFTYVPKNDLYKFKQQLEGNILDIAEVELWDGYLVQFYSEKEVLQVPNLDKRLFFDENFLRVQARTSILAFQNSLLESDIEQGIIFVDNRLRLAERAYNRNKNDIAIQERLIELSIEFSKIDQAIDILERRILSNENYMLEDFERLIVLYGWEGRTDYTELFLERLWLAFPNQKTISTKNLAVSTYGFYGNDFNRKWYERARFLGPVEEKATLEFYASIENEENWPEIKSGLLGLIERNPSSDSLYQYITQRSFYYENSLETIKLLETFPDFSQVQLLPFAATLANIYGYELLDYENALFWADRSPNITNRTKLEWVLAQNNYAEFRNRLARMLRANPANDSLRIYAGTNLYYNGFQEEAKEVLYPAFERGNHKNTVADTLFRNEIFFLNYEDKKELFQKYPAFYDENNLNKLQSDYRRFEGLKVTTDASYRFDNFDNVNARGGISFHTAKRNDISHLFKVEDIYVEKNVTNQSLNFFGLGYVYSRRWTEKLMEFQAGPSAFIGSDNLILSGFASLSRSIDSTFTSLTFNIQPVFTVDGVNQGIYEPGLTVYREDLWMNDKFSTSFFGGFKYYTDNTFEYNGTARGYLNKKFDEFRGRLIGELSYYDATKNNLNAIPYFTPDSQFIQGLGIDLRYRKPDDFEYMNFLELELMAKNEIGIGLFATGRLTYERKLNSFWDFRLGTDFSSSEVYRSNNFFFSISHTFDKDINTLRNK